MRTLVSQSLSSLTAPGPSRNSPKLGKFLMDILVSDFLQYSNSFAENQENKVLSNFILVITTYYTTAHHQTEEAEILNKQQECIKQLQPSSASIRAAKVGDSTKNGIFLSILTEKAWHSSKIHVVLEKIYFILISTQFHWIITIYYRYIRL